MVYDLSLLGSRHDGLGIRTSRLASSNVRDFLVSFKRRKQFNRVCRSTTLLRMHLIIRNVILFPHLLQCLQIQTAHSFSVGTSIDSVTGCSIFGTMTAASP